MKNYIYIFAALILTILISCTEADDAGGFGGSESGTGGSMARFTITGDYLYTVDNMSLRVFDVTNPDIPVYENKVEIWNDVETIFPKDTLLFIGTQTGMVIYSIAEPTTPKYVTEFRHARSCDPVVVNDEYAFVTLNTENTWCGTNTNELHVLYIKYLFDVKLVRTYQMTAPKGLGIDGNLLFVCDNGLKVIDATYPDDLKVLHHFKISAYDVIPLNGLLLVIGDDGLYQYKYNGTDIELISKIPVLRGDLT